MSSGFGEPFKSSFCRESNCVHALFHAAGVVEVWESDNLQGRMFTTNAKWDAFIKGVKAGEFDLPGGGPDAAA